MLRCMHWATPEERRALGQARRKQVGRHQHEALHPKARPASALELVARSMRGRVPALIHLKYQLMAESPFGYFRGAAPVMAADLAQLPSTGIVSQLCGDAHVRNLGAFAAPDGRLVFDINDFDETIRGPFEWDLKRMAASLVLAGRAAGHKDGSARKAAAACIERYAEQMRAFARMPQLEVNRFQVHRLDLAKPVHDALSKAERATPQHIFEQLDSAGFVAAWFFAVRARRRFKEIEADAHARHRRPRRGRRGFARAVSRNARAAAAAPARLLPARRCGVQSCRHRLGGPARLLHLYGGQRSRRSALFADQRRSCVSLRAVSARRQPAAHNGQRAAEGQKFMQIQTDPFLGWTHIGSRQYLVRQLNDHKGRSRSRIWPAPI